MGFKEFRELLVVIQDAGSSKLMRRNIGIVEIAVFKGKDFEFLDLVQNFFMHALVFLPLRIADDPHYRFLKCKVETENLIEADQDEMNEVPFVARAHRLNQGLHNLGDFIMLGIKLVDAESIFFSHVT
ncbi:MAG: hypothetical protein A2045_00875 [Rhodocyclales bacterium GWA2_65_20]|nr:MAG: hypothetical protein A2045_00875 [Rhodocyclales bacterium GWA2_65_20]